MPEICGPCKGRKGYAMSQQPNLFGWVEDDAATARAEAIIDSIAQQIAEQEPPPGATTADMVNAVRQGSRVLLRCYGVEIPDDVFERLVRELCDFNFITDNEGAP
jgi:hypothetical protein